MARDRVVARSRLFAAVVASLAVASSTVAAPSVPEVRAADISDPWTTVAVVAPPTGEDVVRHLRTGSASPAGAALLGEVVVPGARKVVAGADGSALSVLTGAVDDQPAAIRRVAVQSSGALVLESEVIGIGGDALDLAVSPDGRHVYTADGAAGTVTAVDLIRGEAHPIAVGGVPSSLVVAPDGLRAVVLDAAGRILLLDLVSGAVLAEQPVAADPVGIALDDTAGRIVVASRGASDATGEIASFTLDESLSAAGSVMVGEPTAPARPLAVAVTRETGSLIVPLEGEAELARFAHTGSTVIALEPLAVPAVASSVIATLPRGDQVEVALPTADVVGRVDPAAAELDHTYDAAGEVRALIALPGQPVDLAAIGSGPSLRGAIATLAIVADRPDEVVEYRWQVGSSPPESTAAPTLQRSFPIEGGYGIEVEAITALGAGATARFDGRTALAGGSPEARVRFTHTVVVVEKLGELTFRPPANFLEPNNAHFWEVPPGTVQLAITAAGQAGGAGEESGGGFGEVCDAFGESCTNPGGAGGSRPVLRVEVPVGDDELVAPGEVLGIPVAGLFANGHNQLLGGLGGSGGGTDGGRGGNGGGGSGVYLQSPEKGYPWIIVAPGGGGGGGGGLSSFAGVGGSGVAGPSGAAFGEGSPETRGVPRPQCVAGVNAFAIHAGGPAGQEAQRGDAGRSAGAAQTSTGGQGGGGGGCFGGAAGAEGPDSFSGGTGGAGGIGFSLYPSSTTDLGTLGTTTSFVRIEWYGDNPTASAPFTQATPTLRAAVGVAVELAVPFIGIGSAPAAPIGIPEGLEWHCAPEGAVPSCVIRGTPVPGTAGEHPLEIAGTGGTRTVTLIIEEAPGVDAAVPSEVVWATGATQQLPVTATGDPTRVIGVRGDVPAWLSLATGPGAGVAALVGTPPAGAEGAYSLQLVVAQDARSLSTSVESAWVVHDLIVMVVGDDVPSGPPVVVDPPPPTDPSDPDPPPGVDDPDAPDGPATPEGPVAPGDPVDPGAPGEPVPGAGPTGTVREDAVDGAGEGSGAPALGGPATDDPPAADGPLPHDARSLLALGTGAVWPVGLGVVILLLVAAGFALRAWLIRRG